MASEAEIVGILPTQISYQQLLRWTNIAGLLVFYYVCKIIYRLYFSPLSHIPGSKLAGTSISLLGLPHQRIPETISLISSIHYPCAVIPISDILQLRRASTLSIMT
jgi:hypothetical protein